MCSIWEFISEINNTEVDNAKDLDVVMPMYNLIECSDNYSKTSRSSWQYYRGRPALDNNGHIINFSGNSTSFKAKVKITEKSLLHLIQRCWNSSTIKILKGGCKEFSKT